MSAAEMSTSQLGDDEYEMVDHPVDETPTSPPLEDADFEDDDGNNADESTVPEDAGGAEASETKVASPPSPAPQPEPVAMPTPQPAPAAAPEPVAAAPEPVEPKPVEPKPVAAEPKPVAAAPKPASQPAKPSSQPAKAKPSSPAGPTTRRFNFKQYMSPAVEDVLLYKNPVHSGVVVAAVLAVWTLLAVDFGFTLLWLTSFVTGWLLTITLVVSALAFALNKYVTAAVPAQPVQLLLPYLTKATTTVFAVLPTKQAILDQIGSGIDGTTTLYVTVRQAFLCESFAFTAAAIMALWAAQIVGLLSTCTLITLGLVTVFTVPVLYEKFHVQIDQAYDQACAHINNTVGKLWQAKAKQS